MIVWVFRSPCIVYTRGQETPITRGETQTVTWRQGWQNSNNYIIVEYWHMWKYTGDHAQVTAKPMRQWWYINYRDKLIYDNNFSLHISFRVGCKLRAGSTIHVIFTWTNRVADIYLVRIFALTILNFIGPNDCQAECLKPTVLQPTQNNCTARIVG